MRAALIVAALFIAVPAQAQHSNPWLLTWIPSRCCVTSDCCFEVSASDVQSLPNDRWKIKASGQELSRTDWSPDGRYYRCACGWKRNRNIDTNTYCIFVPMQSSALKSGF